MITAHELVELRTSRIKEINTEIKRLQTMKKDLRTMYQHEETAIFFNKIHKIHSSSI